MRYWPKPSRISNRFTKKDNQHTGKLYKKSYELPEEIDQGQGVTTDAHPGSE